MVIENLFFLLSSRHRQDKLLFCSILAHLLLRRHMKEKRNHGMPNDPLPRLVCWSGRTEESITVVLDRLQSQPLDAEYVALLHNIQSEETSGYIFRGFALLVGQNNNKNAELVAKDVQHYNGLKRPVVWVFSGMCASFLQKTIQ